MDGANVLGTGAVNAAGVATYATAALAVATHPLSAVYGGDGNYATSTSGAISQVVNKASTSTTVVSSSTPSLVGTSVTFTATVTAKAPGAGTRSGTVTFSDGGNPIGTGTVNAAGVATFAIATLTAGMHNISADYGGDGNFTGSTSSAFAQNVSASAAMLSLTAAPNATSFGESTSLTATVVGQNGTPTGTVTFNDGATELGTTTLDGTGVATFPTSTLSAGTHTINARYSGSTIYAWAVGSLAHVVDKAKTTTKVTSSLTPAIVGANIVFTATVASTTTGFTGQVELFDGTMSLGTVALSGKTATFATSSLAEGAHAITATYKGDSSFVASTSTMLIQSVNAPTHTGSTLGTEANPNTKADDNGDGGGGCGCRVLPPTAPTGGALLVVLGGALALVARRRRSRD
jgi:hypothetical protein